MDVWRRILVAMAGLMGAAGVGLGAASTHGGFGPNLLLSATFLLLHAAPVLVIGLKGPPGRIWTLSGFLLASGAILFGAQLSIGAILGASLFPMAAPTGGWGMILGWLAMLPGALQAGVKQASG